MNYKNQLVDYVIEAEASDFWDYLLDQSELSEDEIALLIQQGKDMQELDRTIMTKLARRHIFAVAYLAEREGK